MNEPHCCTHMFLHHHEHINCRLFSLSPTYTSCCSECSIEPQMCIDLPLKIVANKYTIMSCLSNHCLKLQYPAVSEIHWFGSFVDLLTLRKSVQYRQPCPLSPADADLLIET